MSPFWATECSGSSPDCKIPLSSDAGRGKVVDKPAWTETIVEKQAEKKWVIDKAAWTETKTVTDKAAWEEAYQKYLNIINK